MNQDLRLKQANICARNAAACLIVNLESIGGISDNVGDGVMPINGMRLNDGEKSSGWYIWAGEFSEAEDFFKPVHLKHLAERFPKAGIFRASDRLEIPNR